MMDIEKLIAQLSRTKPISYQAAITTTTRQIVPYNPKRIAIWFGNSAVSSYYVNTANFQFIGQGLLVANTIPHVHFSLANDGAIVFGPFFALALTGTSNVTIIEAQGP